MAVFKNQMQYQEFNYKFSEHGGAISTITLGSLPVGAIVSEVVAHVVVAPLSTGSATITWGNDDVDGYSGATVAIATLALNTVHNGFDNASPLLWDDTNDHQIHYRIVDTTKAAFTMSIATEVLTAGELKFMVKYFMPA